jgi:Tol biopolymer transport system component
MKRLPVLLLAAVGCALSVAPAARADFGPIELVSKSATAQATVAITPAISADGRYVAFAGQIGGREGVFRKDLQTGELVLVATLGGRFLGEAAPTAHPSISADGRYVAFVTKAPLDPVDDLAKASPDVYVADMSTSPPTYELASALDGCVPGVSAPPCGLTYVEEEGETVPGGSTAAGRVALSADGRRVVFLVRAESDLAGPGTPGGQVAVRDLGTDRTYLVTEREGTEESVSGGGADAQSEGAAISADGSTVAWVGRHLPDQVPMLADEAATIRALEAGAASSPTEQEAHEYHEPLWRRLPTALEAVPPTRRVVGGGDPLAPGCPPGGTLDVSQCQGPFPEVANGRKREEQFVKVEGRGWGTAVPQLDADGGVVAFTGNPEEDRDLFVVDMAPGLSRREAVRRLTKWVNPSPGANSLESIFVQPDAKALAALGPIEECAISPDGNRIAFTSARQLFPLAPPTLVTPAPADSSGVKEIFQFDRRGETIERLAPDGGTGGSHEAGSGANGSGGASAPSYSDEGRFLAFSSTANNLAAGDVNNASDAFVVESPPAAPVNPSAVSHRPATLVVTPLWRMTVTASSLPDGRVQVAVGLPGAGTLRATATARVGKRLRRRRVARHDVQAQTSGLRKVVLALPKGLRGLAKRKGGLYADLDIGFLGAGGKPLHAALDARFVVHRKKVKRKRGGR